MTWRKRKQEREQALAEAERALHESVDHLHGAVRRGQEVHRIAEVLRRIQRENHFADAIRAAYGKGAS